MSVPTRLPFALQRMQANVHARGNTITLTWIERTGGTTDPATRAVLGATETKQTLTVKALTHEVEAKSVVRQFNEIEVGDMIVDFLSDVALDGKDGLRFTIDGREYEMKDVGEKLAKSWDVLIQDRRGLRTVLLKRAI